jgi:hypothetical protein
MIWRLLPSYFKELGLPQTPPKTPDWENHLYLYFSHRLDISANSFSPYDLSSFFSLSSLLIADTIFAILYPRTRKPVCECGETPRCRTLLWPYRENRRAEAAGEAGNPHRVRSVI